MRIGIDARPLSHQLAGVARMLRNIVQELERIDRELRQHIDAFAAICRAHIRALS